MGATCSQREASTSLVVAGRRLGEGSTPTSGCHWRYQAVALDVAGVLYDASLWRRWLTRLVNHMGLAVEYDSVCALWREHYQQDVHSGRREFAEALHALLLNWGFSWAQIDEIEAASPMQSEHIDQDVRALPGVVPAVTRLCQQGLRLVAWADMPRTAEKATALIDRLGLPGCFERVLSSFDEECAQPSPACFDSILAALQLPAGDVLYVGHDASHLAGARAAGMGTSLFDAAAPISAEFPAGLSIDPLDIAVGLSSATGKRYGPRLTRARPVASGRSA